MTIPLAVLCEYVWVLRRSYKESASVIADSISQLVASPNVAVDRPAVQAGLAALRSGGDFADGVAAHEGQWLGAETFLTFDTQAAGLRNNQGVSTTLLS